MLRAFKAMHVKLMMRDRLKLLHDQRIHRNFVSEGSERQEAMPDRHMSWTAVWAQERPKQVPRKGRTGTTGRKGVTPSRSTCCSAPTDKAQSRMRECRLVIGLDGVLHLDMSWACSEASVCLEGAHRESHRR